MHPCYLFVFCLSHEVEFLPPPTPIVLISGTTRESEEAGLNPATSKTVTHPLQSSNGQIKLHLKQLEAQCGASGLFPAKW